MIDFEEELKKFHPSLEVEQVEDNVYRNKPKDMSDLLDEMLERDERRTPPELGSRISERKLCAV